VATLQVGWGGRAVQVEGVKEEGEEGWVGGAGKLGRKCHPGRGGGAGRRGGGEGRQAWQNR